MYKRIAAAYNESPEAGRALAAAIQLAKTLGSELWVVTIMEEPPVYTAYIRPAESPRARTLLDDRSKRYQQLRAAVRDTAQREGITVVTRVLGGDAASALVDFLVQDKPDLLVIGLPRRTSHISRLWSTVYEVAQEAPCSVLGVH